MNVQVLNNHITESGLESYGIQYFNIWLSGQIYFTIYVCVWLYTLNGNMFAGARGQITTTKEMNNRTVSYFETF